MVIAIGPDNQMVEVFIKSPKLNVKKSASTIEREWMAGRLAKALGLPCAYPLQVRVPPELAEFAGDIELAEQLAAGPEVLFGSLRAPAGYAMWSDGTNLPVAYAPVAAQAYLLDCVLQNWDRSISNPNVMTNGSAIFLFDHDEAFAYATDTDLAAAAAAKLPWTKGGIENYYEGTTQHVLWRYLQKHRNVDLVALSAAWKALPEDTYYLDVDAMPPCWDMQAGLAIADYLLSATRNIDAIIQNISHNLHR